MYKYVLSFGADMSSLPVVANHSTPSRRASLAAISRYAKALGLAYPDYRGLIADIELAAKLASDKKATKQLFFQLVDLERYLLATN